MVTPLERMQLKYSPEVMGGVFDLFVVGFVCVSAYLCLYMGAFAFAPSRLAFNSVTGAGLTLVVPILYYDFRLAQSCLAWRKNHK